MIIPNNTLSSSLLNGTDGKIETPNVKKRHRRMKSSGMKNTECDGESCCFLVSCASSDGYAVYIACRNMKTLRPSHQF